MRVTVANPRPARAVPLGLEPTLERASAAAPESGWPLPVMPALAGFPAPADDGVEYRLSLDEHLIRQPASTGLLRVEGDAWRALGIHDGDLLIIDRTTPPTTGSLVVVVIQGEFVLRQVGRDGEGRRVLQSAPAEAPDPGLDTAREATLWGVARWVIHRLWPGREP